MIDVLSPMNPGTEGTGTINPHGNFESADHKPSRFNTLHTDNINKQHQSTLQTANDVAFQSSSLHKFDSKATEHKLDKLHESIGAEMY